MNRNVLIRWKVLLALSTMLLFTLLLVPNIVYATEESDTWIIPSNSYNKYQETISTEGDYIVQQGMHPKGSSSVFYRTSGYYMTLDKCDDTYTSTGAFDSVSKKYLSVKVSDVTQGNSVTTTYKTKKAEFISALQNLGVTSKMIQKNGGSITVYIHNIFEIYNPNKAGDPVYRNYTDILGYKEMINAGNKITGNHGGWPADTEKALKYYYNFPYVVKPTLFDVDIVAIDSKGNKLKTLQTGNVGMYNEKYPLESDYNAPNTITTEEGVTYTTRKQWYRKYYSRTEAQWMEGTHHNGDIISDYLPDAKKDKTVTYYIVYEPKTETDIIINAVEQDKKDNILKLLYKDKVSPEEDFEQPDNTINPTILESGITYKRTINYSYTYTSKTGVKTKSGTLSKTNSAFSLKIPSDIKDETTITVSIYYAKTVPGQIPIPITITAVNKETGDIIQSLGSGSITGGEVYSNSEAIKDIITSGSTSYTYSGSWDCSYTKNTSIMKTPGSGTTINFTAPSADTIKGGISIKVYYNKKPVNIGKITLRVIMVGSTGKLISEISTETVALGQSISKNASTMKTINSVTYQYLSKWDYDYKTTSGSITKSGTGTTAAFLIPTITSNDSTVTLRFYYEPNSTVVVPKPSSPISEILDSPSPYGVINGDSYNSPYFTSKQGISTTESQYVYVKTKDYLLGYTLTNKTGKVTYKVPVTIHYTLNYNSATPMEYGASKKITEDVLDTQMIKVEKAYSYWEITNLEYYYVGSANVYNYSLPNGSVALNANNNYLDLPALSTLHSSEIKDHVLEPKQIKEGIEVWAEKPFTSITSDRPKIEYEDLTSYALTLTDNPQVKNDYLSFDGDVILSSTKEETIAPEPEIGSLKQCTTITKDKAIYSEGRIIEAEKENGTYSSNGSVTYYLNPNSVNASYSSKVFNIAVNDVVIHTPVICDPVICADNNKWSQVIKAEEDAIQIVLDPNTSLNDFTVKISNTLQHSSRLGYYSRDFSRSFIDPANISYIAKKSNVVRNEMKLPFDVYIDTLGDDKEVNDKFIKAGTWIVLGRATSKFYVPLWVEEGTYEAEFRTIAVNGTDKLNKSERTRNSSVSNYVATQTKTFQVSGRIYGLTIYDISDYPTWKEIFRKDETMLFKWFEGSTDGTKRSNYDSDDSYYYTVGTKDQYGNNTGRYNKYTFPLINGSHPKYSNRGVLKTGYAVRFMLNTTGEMYSNGSFVKITPTFYYVDSKGKNRQQVDLYYKEEINKTAYPLVKMGEGIDLVNIQSGTTGNIYSRIPERELKQTAAVMKSTYAKLTKQKSTMYSYTLIKLLPAFRTFIGTDYASLITGLDSYSDVKDATGQTKTNISKYMQRWYGTYKIPTNVHAVPTGYDVFGYMKKHGIDYKEAFWLTDGYIIVNFNIVTVDDNGIEHLSYINASNYLNNNKCSMWVTEGAMTQKTDNKGTNFNFKAGDFIVYNTDKKASDDYEGELY